MVVTKHAADRLRERKGTKRCNVDKVAEKAFNQGIRHKDTTGSLNRYITALYFEHRKANNTRIYGNNVYLFHNETLITVVPLPQRYHAICAKLRRKKDDEDGD